LKILITNDDGIEAEGMQCLVEVLAKNAECFVVAPDQGRSCCSHGVTTGSSLEVVSRRSNQWTVSGTPADCVRVGLLYLNLRPDWVVSGVNHGGNLGVDILYSGTAAGAREASLFGVSSVAISQYMRRDVERDWGLNAKRAETVFQKILDWERTGAGFWNINLPALPMEMTGMDFPVSLCEPEFQSLSYSMEEIEKTWEILGESLIKADPMPSRTVLYRSNYQARPRVSGSDVDLCFGGHATVSWLQSGPGGRAE
jgi:5'-nucleotidase